nr:RNA-directed DNA polymerase, eukaryota, reverse transcriptase zinc-binding domain protein [Tanacetum cinerariifolium]
MGKQSITTDANGWTWIFRNNKNPNTKGLEKAATTFYVSNIPDSLDAKGLWKASSPSFKVDERLIWVEINGLRLCAWGSNVFKKVTEKVRVEVHGEIFEVHVHELGTWSINITDDSIDTSSHIDVNEIEKVVDSIKENSVDDLNDLNDNFNEMAHGINEDEVQMDNLNATTMEQP